MSHITCHVSGVICHIFICSYKVLKLVVGGSVINGLRHLVCIPFGFISNVIFNIVPDIVSAIVSDIVFITVSITESAI